jgi:hypothetical protein
MLRSSDRTREFRASLLARCSQRSAHEEIAMSHLIDIGLPEPLEQQIAARAHERWIRRGRPPGDGTEDWFAARAELREERARKAHDEEIAIYD